MMKNKNKNKNKNIEQDQEQSSLSASLPSHREGAWWEILGAKRSKQQQEQEKQQQVQHDDKFKENVNPDVPIELFWNQIEKFVKLARHGQHLCTNKQTQNQGKQHHEGTIDRSNDRSYNQQRRDQTHRLIMSVLIPFLVYSRMCCSWT